MQTNRYKYFRWTARTGWLTVAYVVAFPAFIGYMAMATDVSRILFPRLLSQEEERRRWSDAAVEFEDQITGNRSWDIGDALSDAQPRSRKYWLTKTHRANGICEGREGETQCLSFDCLNDHIFPGAGVWCRCCKELQ